MVRAYCSNKYSTVEKKTNTFKICSKTRKNWLWGAISGLEGFLKGSQKPPLTVFTIPLDKKMNPNLNPNIFLAQEAKQGLLFDLVV